MSRVKGTCTDRKEFVSTLLTGKDRPHHIPLRLAFALPSRQMDVVLRNDWFGGLSERMREKLPPLVVPVLEFARQFLEHRYYIWLTAFGDTRWVPSELQILDDAIHRTRSAIY